VSRSNSSEVYSLSSVKKDIWDLINKGKYLDPLVNDVIMDSINHLQIAKNHKDFENALQGLSLVSVSKNLKTMLAKYDFITNVQRFIISNYRILMIRPVNNEDRHLLIALLQNLQCTVFSEKHQVLLQQQVLKSISKGFLNVLEDVANMEAEVVCISSHKLAVEMLSFFRWLTAKMDSVMLEIFISSKKTFEVFMMICY
jgi:hypothetical protein